MPRWQVVVLVGTGWSYMKPLLANKEKQILMVVIPLQVCAEVAIVIMDTNTPASRSWFTWRDVLHLVDIICCCAILFPIVWSIKHLREASQVGPSSVYLGMHICACLHRLQCCKGGPICVIIGMYMC